ncbi:MAG: carbohydrate porin [Magnetococcales bacterium]|nr:carbohydrate porin [Magnetococcales bacterium]MBF0116964.1 carbohydrate porin [Magnetococcales bacterium]
MANKLVKYVFLLLVVSNIAVAEDEKIPDWNTGTLSGDWGGIRSSLHKRGISLELSHKSDVMTNVSGGIKQGTAWMGYTDAKVEIDMETLFGWNATTAYIFYHSELGSKFDRDYVGSFLSVNNIEVGTNTAQFLHAWMKKHFFDNSLSVLAGLYAVDSEFYVTDASAVFTQTPYGMANDLGQSGPPIYPVGALAVRAKYVSPKQHFYLQGALADGIPGDPNDPRGTHIKLGDGTFSIVELGYTPQADKQPSTSEQQDDRVESTFLKKISVGFWKYSTPADDQDSTKLDATGNPIRHPNQGAYFLVERTLLAEEEDPSQGLTGFVRFGMASQEVYQTDWTSSAGLNYRGLIAERDDDITAVGVTVSHASDTYQRVNASLGSETSVEATYRAQVNKWLALQPTLQHVLHPNMDPSAQDAWVFGVRIETIL